MVYKYMGHAVRCNLVLLCVNGHIGLKQNDIEMIEDLQHFRKPVSVVLTKLDKIKGEGELARIATETSHQLLKYSHFVNPKLHLVCSHHFFGMKELRARIGIAFDEDNSNITTGGRAPIPPARRL